MIFDDLPDVSDEEFEEIIVRRFRELRAAIFRILPEGCLLRPRRILIVLLNLVSVELINAGLVEPKDICSFCPLRECPYNYVSDGGERRKKIFLLAMPPKNNKGN